MKKLIIVFLSMIGALSLALNVVGFFVITDKTKFEAAIYERAYVQASEYSEHLADSLDAAGRDAFASDVSDVKKYSELLSLKLGELSLDGNKSERLWRFLSFLKETSQNALEEGADKEYYRELFLKYASFSKRLDEEFVPSIENGADYEILNDIFSELEEPNLQSAETFSMLKRSTLFDKKEVLPTVNKIFGKSAKLTSALVHSFPTFYNFYCENASIDISQMGGYVLRMLYDHRPSGPECDADTAKLKMREFLADRGLEELALVDFYENDDFFASFAPVINTDAGEILCLSETVHMCVGRDFSKVRSYDAENYYRYHKNSRNVTPKNIPEGSRLVYIVSTGGDEVLCYEKDGIYFNVENGARETKI